MAKIATNQDILVPDEVLINKIYMIRGQKVMVDADLAVLYEVETKQLKRQVRRNEDRFPNDFAFELTVEEYNSLRSQIGTLKRGEHAKYLPMVFTEMGLSMLSSVLNSPKAIKVNIQIMRIFTRIRLMLSNSENNSLQIEQVKNAIEKQNARLDNHDKNFDIIFKYLDKFQENDLSTLKQGIFYDDQIFDAYTFVADLIRKAKTSIVLIDNYIDDTVLQLFTKRKKGVSFTIYTKTISKQLVLDVQKHNAQYEPVIIKEFSYAHDRFLIMDGNTLYHIGASLKDLGKKWFAFSKMDSEVLGMLNRLGEI